MSGFFKWYLQESNQGHTDFQSVALPTELRYLPDSTVLLAECGCKYRTNFIFSKTIFKKNLFVYLWPNKKRHASRNRYRKY